MAIKKRHDTALNMEMLNEIIAYMSKIVLIEVFFECERCMEKDFKRKWGSVFDFSIFPVIFVCLLALNCTKASIVWVKAAWKWKKGHFF